MPSQDQPHPAVALFGVLIVSKGLTLIRALAATIDAIMRKMLKRMNDEFHLIKAKVPLGIDENDTTSPQAHILLSYVRSTGHHPCGYVLIIDLARQNVEKCGSNRSNNARWTLCNNSPGAETSERLLILVPGTMET